MNQNRGKRITFQKVMNSIAGIAFLLYVIFQVLEIAGKVESADMISFIALSVVCICDIFLFWNTKRILSYIAIAGATCLIGTVVLISVL